ncbi:MAG: SGNH/GDSL hydrolase family protein [Gemmatimonadota bacterium]
MKPRYLAASLALALAILAGCHSDDSLNPPASPPVPSGGAIFQRYVALGNSITAGVQSAGINDSTQARSYALLVAEAMGTSFIYPRLNMPGCPPPFLNNVTQTRVNLPGLPPPDDMTCYLRQSNVTPNNVAVPFARATEVLTNFAVPSRANALTTMFLGGRNQVKAMRDQNPTFVSLWIGNNDALAALTNLVNPGNPDSVTDVAVFQSQYTAILDSIAATGAQAVLLTVADISVIPYASRGSVYWCLRTGLCPGIPQQLPSALTVSNNCAPNAAIPGSKGDSILVPWPIGVPKIAAAAAGQPTTLDCSVDTDVITPSEYAGLRNAVLGFNTFIQTQAATRGYAFVDVNPPLLQKVGTGEIPPFPDLSQALSGGNIGFGPLFSLDGVHPSTVAHRLVADSVASAINQKYGTTLPVPVCGAISCPN